jgi:hypothetical protein
MEDEKFDNEYDKVIDCEKLDCRSLISLITCVRNDANLNTRLFWESFQRQLSFSGFLIVGLGLVLRVFEISLISCLAGLCIGIIGVAISWLLLTSAKGNDLHVDEYNKSCEQLERYLPDTIRNYAVMHTYKNKIQPNLKSKIKPKMFYLSIILIIFWVIIMLSSLFCALAFSPNVKSVIELITKPLT